MHGGNSGNPGNHPRSVDRAHAVVQARQLLFKRLGLSWYGGRTPGRTKVLSRMDDALRVADALIEQGGVALSGELAPLLPGTGHAKVLEEGAYLGLELQRDTVLMVKAQLDRSGEDIDVKLLRAGNEAARDLTRLAVRVAEGAFKAQQGNQLVALLEQLKAAQERKRS
jgi:hypothetical protein